ncbi:hypothetical protein TSUD_360720 [Trifolium subterraneum]|uniref:Uncharacterized protein n=1 Tax=Trifolium subterraneum TaxID=3900 RepID=A0A2Z6NJM9_TRISU|nr:hypothetical protein TSUD_360720 [Trifolium subterraneum]
MKNFQDISLSSPPRFAPIETNIPTSHLLILAGKELEHLTEDETMAPKHEATIRGIWDKKNQRIEINVPTGLLLIIAGKQLEHLA